MQNEYNDFISLKMQLLSINMNCFFSFLLELVFEFEKPFYLQKGLFTKYF